MGFKFRKKIKIAPGLSINVSKSGVSASIGGKGATTNIGRKGVKSTIGIPGSGLSWSFGPSKSNKPKVVNKIIEDPASDDDNQKARVHWWRLLVFVAIALIYAASKS